MTVVIGVDPHKGSHTAMAVDETEKALAELKVRSGPAQLERLLAWAQRFPKRSWAVENATGLNYLLANSSSGPASGSSTSGPASGSSTSRPSWELASGCATTVR